MKKISVVLLLLVLFGVQTNAAFADTTNPQNDITQEEINARMEIVLDYLNEHANDAVPDGQSSLIFNIPVDEGVTVTAEIMNQEVSRARLSVSSNYSMNVTANSSYWYA